MSSHTPPLLRSVLECGGCGWRAPQTEPLPFRCAHAGQGDDIDHVLQRRLEAIEKAPGASAEPAPGEAVGPTAACRAAFGGVERNPFVRFRPLLHSYLTARAGGLDDTAFVGLAERLDERIAEVSGSRLRCTPCERVPELARALGVAELWIKDETQNPSGSHKVRHMAGLALWLAQLERRVELGLLGDVPARHAPWAIASCGNAALAAAVVARAVLHPLDVFVPEHAHPTVLLELERLGARVHTCRRTPEHPGDPCYRALQRALAQGALPFSCQGPDNGLVIEGGATLAWETAATLRGEGSAIDRLFVQVGGGALATACVRGLSEALQLGVLERLPRIHAVQTEAAHPLADAWDRVTADLLEEAAKACAVRPPAALLDSQRRPLRGAWIHRHIAPARIAEALRRAAHRRSETMRPIAGEPHSAATGILDDETYDWLAVTTGMLLTGGSPVVVSEERLAEAHRRARQATGIPADATGTSGLAGALELAASGTLSAGERVAVLFTGIERAAAS